MVAVSTSLGVSQNVHGAKSPSLNHIIHPPHQITTPEPMLPIPLAFCCTLLLIPSHILPWEAISLLRPAPFPCGSCEWQTSSVQHPDMNISGILSALGKPPAHPQALAVSKLCRFLNEHSCLPYALDCMGKPDPLPQPELTGRIFELLPVKQPYKRKQQTNFLGMQEAWTPISS